jgi:hypothetical protein
MFQLVFSFFIDPLFYWTWLGSHTPVKCNLPCIPCLCLSDRVGTEKNSQLHTGVALKCMTTGIRGPFSALAPTAHCHPGLSCCLLQHDGFLSAFFSESCHPVLKSFLTEHKGEQSQTSTVPARLLALCLSSVSSCSAVEMDCPGSWCR